MEGLTLITGQPGNGKTALAVDRLMTWQSENPGRLVFVWGIPELALAHEKAPPVAEWTVRERVPEDPSLEQCRFDLPTGSLLIVDEAQTIFRPRGTGAKVPDCVAAFETFRHTGISIWLITQNPTLVDANIRKLCNRHLHVRASWSGRSVFEWNEAADPMSSSDRARAVKSVYKLPKRVYGLYKSSSMHHKVSRRLPFSVYATAGAGLVCVFLGWRAYAHIWGDDALTAVEEGNVKSRVEHPLPTAQPAGAVVRREVWRLVSSMEVRVKRRVIRSRYTLENEWGDRREASACTELPGGLVCSLGGRRVEVSRQVLRDENWVSRGTKRGRGFLKRASSRM